MQRNFYVVIYQNLHYSVKYFIQLLSRQVY